jgi:hypothetical protein
MDDEEDEGEEEEEGTVEADEDEDEQVLGNGDGEQLLQNRKVFDREYQKFCDRQNIQGRPIIMQREIDMFLMFRSVLSRGGFQAVSWFC